MLQSTTSPVSLPIRQTIRELLQQRITETVETVIEEELTELLGSDRYERTGDRRGYRNGRLIRSITTENGPREINLPRARLIDDSGQSTEFHSTIIPRYSRRTKLVDEAILGVYLAGGNSRRIRKALAPLLGTANLSKSAISRVVARLKGQFATWSQRDLAEEIYRILVLDAIHLKVRLARRVVSVPVLTVMGVDEAGNKRLVALRLAVSEAAANWGSLIDDLTARGLPSPGLLLCDGHKGLRCAIKAWPEARLQPCTQHKRENLKAACPAHARPEMLRDYTAIVDAEDGGVARKAYDAFLAKWRAQCPPVARSLEEAGLDILTFYEYPKAMWKSLKTTNTIENLNREFRRRTKTQGSFPTEEAAITLLFGLVAFGQIRMRKINGHQYVTEIVVPGCRDAA
jgi:putative transposase